MNKSIQRESQIKFTGIIFASFVFLIIICIFFSRCNNPVSHEQPVSNDTCHTDSVHCDTVVLGETKAK